jgi:hypothetical protein
MGAQVVRSWIRRYMRNPVIDRPSALYPHKRRFPRSTAGRLRAPRLVMKRKRNRPSRPIRHFVFAKFQ